MENSNNKENTDQYYKVLVVDDTIEHLYFLSNILEHNKITTFHASNGKSAIEFAQKENLDLILLDVSMPEMNGFEVCKILKTHPITKEIPVVFITARDDKDYVIRGLEAGAVDYIIKPYNTKELITRVFTQIELKKNRDIIKEQNKRLEEKNLQLLELNATKNKFFGIIAHDLKNPFGGSLQLTDLLLADFEHYTENEKKQMLQVILEALKQGYSLLENLLEWSRSQLGQIHVRIEKTNILNVVSEVIAQISNMANQKQINIYTHVSDKLIVLADIEMLKTILRNLVSNAVKFSFANGRIDIRTREENGYILIDIEDVGTGIEIDAIPKLFKIDEKYTQLGTADEIGTGLGLVLCKEFIEKNNGKILVKSEVGIGSIFTIKIPKLK